MNVRSEFELPPDADVEDGPRKRGRPRVGDKRRQILDAALKMFSERGYHGTSVPEVAREAGVGAGTLYRYFANKEDLVNEVFRDAKTRLAAAMYASTDGPVDASPRGWFLGMWSRLVRFARAEPTAFRFLEMQDHSPYLDQKSRDTELMVLAPMWFAGKELERKGLTRNLSAEVLMAFAWGALVGLLKAESSGYLRIDDPTLNKAGEACWAAIERPGQ
jgi:TetR/AcrR family transcriptional regulator, repressor of fatR-cypB operon